MNYDQNVASLTSIAEWCRQQYVGITSAKTGKQATVPMYWIVKCRKCGDLSLQKKPSYRLVMGDDGKRHRADAVPGRCPYKIKHENDAKKMSLPRVKPCKGEVSTIKTIGE